MFTTSSAAIVACAIVVAVPAARGQGVFREHHGNPGDRLGIGLATAGDVDHDGIDDYALGSPYEAVSSTASGVARVHSGATGALLWKFSGTTHAEFGWSVDGGADVDADGYADLIVGSDGFNSVEPNAGMAQVFSGRTGAELFALYGEKANNQFSHELAFVGDLDLDGHVDFAIGAPR